MVCSEANEKIRKSLVKSGLINTVPELKLALPC
jgi:hypothetical protein